MSLLELMPATELHRGRVYALELDKTLGPEAYQRLAAEIARAEREMGIRFVVLDYGIRLSRGEAKDVTEERTKDGDERTTAD